jgi:hypothetical protein
VEQIRQAGGLINKADSDGYADSVNLRQPWNPFSKATNRTDYFYRKNKKDNCLATVVSISTSFKTAATFPLLNGDFISGLPAALPTEAQVNGLSMAMKKHFHRVKSTIPAQGTLIRVADRQQLYLVVVEGNFFDTEGAQARREGEANKFPEFAVKRVPETGVLACVAFVRVHHSLDEHGGLTALLDASRCVAPTLDGCRRYTQSQAAAKQLYQAVKQEYDTTLATFPFHVKWTATKGVDVPPLSVNGAVFTIAEVKNLLGQKAWP